MTNPEELVISSVIDDQIRCEYPIPRLSFCFMMKTICFMPSLYVLEPAGLWSGVGLEQ